MDQRQSADITEHHRKCLRALLHRITGVPDPSRTCLGMPTAHVVCLQEVVCSFKCIISEWINDLAPQYRLVDPPGGGCAEYTNVVMYDSSQMECSIGVAPKRTRFKDSSFGRDVLTLDLLLKRRPNLVRVATFHLDSGGSTRSRAVRASQLEEIYTVLQEPVPPTIATGPDTVPSIMVAIGDTNMRNGEYPPMSTTQPGNPMEHSKRVFFDAMSIVTEERLGGPGTWGVALSDMFERRCVEINLSQMKAASKYGGSGTMDSPLAEFDRCFLLGAATERAKSCPGPVLPSPFTDEIQTFEVKSVHYVTPFLLNYLSPGEGGQRAPSTFSICTDHFGIRCEVEARPLGKGRKDANAKAENSERGKRVRDVECVDEPKE